jgi:AmiR/NasT family two-component response regulator
MSYSQPHVTPSHEPATLRDAARWRCQGGDAGTTARLVIVHASPEQRLAWRALLEALSHQVIGEAGDLESARRLAWQLRPDLVLLPAALGDEDGFAAAEAIRRDAELPVFFLSESADPALLDRARAAGCAGFLAQPFTEAALGIALRMALDRHAEAQALRRELADLKEKLEARKLINRAKAILMERHGLSEPEAFRHLQSQSMNTATPMKALAEAIILSARVMGDDPKRRPTA